MVKASETKRGWGVIAELRELIYTGHLQPGEHLRQDELATQLGVSRVPLREAMLVLTSQGILTHESNRGFRVVKRSADEQAQIHWMLRTLENEVYRNIEWPSAEELNELVEINERMAAAVDSDDPGAVPKLNHDFHMKLWTFCSVKIIANELARVWGMSTISLTRIYENRDRVLLALEEHQQIIDALRTRDQEALFAATEQHRLTSSGANLRRTVTTLPQ